MIRHVWAGLLSAAFYLVVVAAVAIIYWLLAATVNQTFALFAMAIAALTFVLAAVIDWMRP